LGASPANRVRITGDWLLDAVLAPQAVQFGLVWAATVPLDVSGPPPPVSTSGYQPASPRLQTVKPIIRDTEGEHITKEEP
jgi:hypothetical protein